jgi:hypothetical protein
MYDQRTTDAIRVLALVVRVVPESTSGISLVLVRAAAALIIQLNDRGTQEGKVINGLVSLTVNLYVNVPPGGIKHWLTPVGPSIVLVPCCLLLVNT